MIRGSSGGEGNIGISTSPTGPAVVEQPDNKIIIIPQTKKRGNKIYLSIGMIGNFNYVNTEQKMCQQLKFCGIIIA